MSDRSHAYTIHYSCILMDYFTISGLLYAPGIQDSVYKFCYLFPYNRCIESVHSRSGTFTQSIHDQHLNPLALFLAFISKLHYECHFFENRLAQLMEE